MHRKTAWKPVLTIPIMSEKETSIQHETFLDNDYRRGDHEFLVIRREQRLM